MVNVKIVGALGYGGVGMIELLCRHPEARVAQLVDVEGAGSPVSDIWPHLAGYCDTVIHAPDQSEPGSTDIVFCATPDGVGQKVAPAEVAAGARVVDYSGDFRFNNTDTYAGYASRIGKPVEHRCPDLLQQSVYGLTELHRGEIATASVVGNPGCFAVATTLGLAPIAQSKCADVTDLISDAKTGVSGAGKNPSPTFHYPARYDNMNAYKIAAHQHTYEIEHELSRLAGTGVTVTLTTQVVPQTRGIMAVLYAKLDEGWCDADKLFELYSDFFAGNPFVRVVPAGASACTADVRGSNRCLIWTNVDRHSGRAVVIGHIDNLVKGQAGSALQNLNVMFGLDETTGLDQPGPRP